MDSRTITKYGRQITNLKGLKNLLIKCDDYIVNCDADQRLHIKINNSCKPLESEFCWKELLDFVKLLLTACHVDRHTISTKFWTKVFLPVIENKNSNLCQFFLTIMTNIENHRWELFYHYVLEGLSHAMVNQDNSTSKVIAWFITKKFFLSLDKSIRDNILDIWPAFNCSCYRRKEVICSGKIEITIEISTIFPDLPDTFWKMDVNFITDDRIKNKEGYLMHEHLQYSSCKIHFQNKETISIVDAKQLFIEHSNLTLICKSSFKSTGFRMNKHNVIEQSCFQLYCKGKGSIPIGENHFPRTLNGLQTDILEGCPHLLTQLKIGSEVGRDNLKRGTLGGFVQVRGAKAFLTCLHVFLTTDELAADNLSLDDETTVPVKLYWENGNSHICGTIRDIAFEVDNERETSIDAALVEIPADSIDFTNYIQKQSGQLSFIDLGMKSGFLNHSCVDYKHLLYSVPKPVLRTVTVGAVSGFMDKQEAQVNENKENYIDLESIDNLFSTVIINEIKNSVDIVLQSLQKDNAVSLDENNLKMYIEDKYKFPLVIKTIIIEVILHIYPTLQFLNEDDICNVIWCKISNRFSEITADVHMQQAFLKKTGKDMAIKRTSRRVYNQIYISNIPFQPGDSGTCIYVLSPVQGCIGMAIADHPQGGCIATPIMDILKHFKIRIK